MRYLSLFSGIEAATVAWRDLGWSPVAFSEIEKFPCELLEHHYPDVKNLGDITKITESTIKKLGEIDLVVFGSPCQDLSVAGKSKGLEGERSGLFKSAIKIIKWARKNNGCRYSLWENVPGAFSSNKGRDFSEVIRLLSGSTFNPEKWQTSGVAIGKEGLTEWRTLNAKHFGVPQNRRRIFAFTDYSGECRQPVLFEQKSVSGNIESSRAQRESDTKRINGGVVARMRGFGDYTVDNTCSALKQRDYKDATDLVIYPIHDKATRFNGKTGVGSGNGFGVGGKTSPCPTLTTGDRHSICYSVISDVTPKITKEYVGALRANGGGGIVPPAVSVPSKNIVRRLTPIECERLQGFSDNYTKISEATSNASRYKALGNSMAVPVMKWIGSRINEVKTL